MEPQFERRFELWEEYDLEVDQDLKAELSERFHSEIKVFLRRNNVALTSWDFVRSMRPDYKNWRRNKH